ncbi:MAG: hypothetical protein KME10_01150 [Plectolyngbya sp. WJT66-NPBG17]|nr:hypothetical protein [Plectolyngbya sp. WJT66-NPBG17]
MTPTQFAHAVCSLSLLIGIHLISGSLHSVCAQLEPPPGAPAPSGTVGGGSRS